MQFVNISNIVVYELIIFDVSNSDPCGKKHEPKLKWENKTDDEIHAENTPAKLTKMVKTLKLQQNITSIKFNINN